MLYELVFKIESGRFSNIMMAFIVFRLEIKSIHADSQTNFVWCKVEVDTTENDLEMFNNWIKHQGGIDLKVKKI